MDELNTAIRALLVELNNRPYQRLPGSRRSVFEALDRPAMRALPSSPYVFAEWKEVTVAFDYHVEIDGHYYSVPHALVGHSAWARFSAASVEVFFRSERVSSHVRSYQRGMHTTIGEHMPKSHRAHAEWSPQRLIHWGVSIGVNTGAVVEHLLRSKPHPEQGYRPPETTDHRALCTCHLAGSLTCALTHRRMKFLRVFLKIGEEPASLFLAPSTSRIWTVNK